MRRVQCEIEVRGDHEVHGPGKTSRLGPRGVIACVTALLLPGCGEGTSPIDLGGPVDLEGPEPNPVGCDLNLDFLIPAGAIDAIPSIDSPNLISAKEEIPAYLDSDTRVIGLRVDGAAYAIPHNVLWAHEIVNLEAGGRHLAITYCPLTGSSLAFDRGPADNATFGVAGLLFQNNLVLFDRNDPSSRWPQMIGEARCGPRLGTALPQWPVVEMRWDAWVKLHPATFVLSEDQGYPFPYRQTNYPYGSYEQYSFESFWIPSAMPELDLRRPTKERVLGVPGSRSDGLDGIRDHGIAFPFDSLTDLEGSFQALDFRYELEDAVVLWSDYARGGMAFRPWTEAGQAVSLIATDTAFEDTETGSVWTVDGRAVSGPLVGETLVPIQRTYVAFWGAWSAFHPQTRLWGPWIFPSDPAPGRANLRSLRL